MPQPQKRSHSHREKTQASTPEEGEEEPPQSRPKPSEMADFTTQAFRHVVAATRCCNSFPQGAARSLYLSYPGYSRIVDEQSQRVLGLIGKVLRSQQIKGEVQRRQLDEQFEMVQECNDILFERINTNLDIKSGLRRNQHVVLETQVDVLSSSSATPAESSSSVNETPRAGSWNRSSNAPNSAVAKVARLFTAANIMRPQMRFKLPVDNSAASPFVPRLREKPNSLKPLALLPEYDEAGHIASYLHPYEFELLKFEPPAAQLQKQQPQLPPSPAQSELFVVDTAEQLKQALEELRQEKLIAIDVEHHSYRTFMGITCLVQMSTRHKDYIFDTLALREEMQQLNLVLTDPKVVKILHGADMDIEWLQRDLSLYIVNMFDTHRAARQLNMARLSLAFLLKHYVDLDVDKSFQLADWRMRPLPPALIDYARQDTHYLIYIYERLTNDLLASEHGQPQALRSVYQLSTEVCKKRYNKPHINQDSHLDLVRKTKRAFDNRQLFALRGIFAWRDATARMEDESYGYVLPNHMMLQIAESLPREMQGILACCNPIPPLVRQQLHTLHQIVLRAREQPLVKPILETRSSALAPAAPTRDFSSKLYCPHDFSRIEEARDNLPTLLKRSSKTGKLEVPSPPLHSELESAKIQPALSLFEQPPTPTLEAELRWCRLRQERQTQCMPYKRYLAILPLMEQLKREQATREHNQLLQRRLCPAAPAPADIKLEAEKAEPEDLYSLPLKEQLKRKQQPKAEEQLAAKRHKKEETRQATPAKKDEELASTSVVEIADSDEEDDDDAVVERPIEKQQKQPPQALSKRQQKQQRFKAKARVQAQSSNRAVQQPPAKQNFDYKNVNFKQFQGGAQRARGTEIKTNLRGRNRPNNRNNKQFNKLFTFSNVRKEGKK